MSTWSYNLSIVFCELFLNLLSFPSFYNYKIDADYDFKNSFPKRKHVFKLLPLVFREINKLVKNPNLREPDYVIKQIVIVGTYCRHKFQDFQSDRMLLVFQNLIHFTVFIEEKQKTKNFTTVWYVILNWLGSYNAQNFLLSMYLILW